MAAGGPRKRPSQALVASSSMKKRSAIEAAYVVLSETGEALRVEEITERILARRLWEPRGKTPVDSVNARIAVDIKRNGNASRFKRVAASTYAVRS